MDILPLLCGLGNVKLPIDRKIDGKNIISILQGKEKTTPHDLLYYYNGTSLQAVREGKWKLHLPRTTKDQPFWHKRKGSGRIFVDLEKPTLFNLNTDIQEKKNVADQHPNIVSQLLQRATEIRKELGDVRQQGSDQRKINLENPQER